MILLNYPDPESIPLEVEYVPYSQSVLRRGSELSTLQVDPYEGVRDRTAGNALQTRIRRTTTHLTVSTLSEWHDSGSVSMHLPLDANGRIRTRRTRPEVVVDPSSHALFVGSIRELANKLLGIIHRAALSNYIQVSRVEFRGFFDADEGVSELVLVQYVNVSARVAMEYWEKPGAIIEAWIDTLPSNQRNVVDDKIDVEVRWG